jgi:hypothetical protein
VQITLSCPQPNDPSRKLLFVKGINVNGILVTSSLCNNIMLTVSRDIKDAHGPLDLCSNPSCLGSCFTDHILHLLGQKTKSFMRN